ncbi:MAG: Uma2 family endonuclease [SAR202 cluster bacterium]|nr:Uma2 family endonuclease [SAR202 cluster bacterium]
MTLQRTRRRFTAEDYHRMAQAGILGEDDRVELIEGEIVEMAPIGSRHQAYVDRLNTLFARRMEGRAIIRVQGPIVLGGDSEPQPDLALLRPRPDYYAGAHPTPEDVLLLVEVSDSSGDYDRQVKAPLYARHGILEYWLVGLEAGVVEVYRQPAPEGYQQVSQVARGQRLTLQAFPSLKVRVEDVLG